MKTRRTRPICLLFLGWLVVGLANANPGAAAGPLKVSSVNPRYFTDESGRGIYLTGSHVGWELQDNAWGREIIFDYRAFLDFLVKHNHNLIRMWVVENTRWDKGLTAVATPMPYRRTGPGMALDGRPRFDLSEFDQSYFRRLRSRAVAARNRGIYVMVMLFQGFSVHKDGLGRNPWFGIRSIRTTTSMELTAT